VADHRADGRVKHVTRDVEVHAVGDLLEHAPRATLAFVDGDAVDLLPVRSRLSDARHFFGVSARTAPDLDRHEVVLILDGGAYWFELRGISVRGMASRTEPPPSDEPQRVVWYVITPRRTLAWDYASLHEE
jgi:hypothetical protein